MIIRPYCHKDRSAWDEYVLNHPRGSAFHFSAWAEAVSNAYDFEGCCLVARSGKGGCGTIKGILPLVHHHLPGGLGRALVSLPYCDAAGPLADSDTIARQLLLKAFGLARQRSARNVSIRSAIPFAGIDGALTRHPEKVRMILRLPDSSDKLFSEFKAKLRSQVRKPFRDGLYHEIGGRRLLRAFYPVFAENMRDLGSPVHSMAWLSSLLEGYGNRAHVVVVRLPDKTPAAGGIILCHPGQVSVPWASSLRRYNPVNPNMLLYWTFLKFACDMGYPRFDFGRSTIGEGTYRFKEQWGSTPHAIHWCGFTARKTDRLETAVCPVPPPRPGKPGIDRETIETIYRNIPLPLSRGIGNSIRKYIAL